MNILLFTALATVTAATPIASGAATPTAPPIQKPVDATPSPDPGPVKDEAAAIKAATNYFKAKIQSNGPSEDDGKPKAMYFKRENLWTVSWGRIVIVVNADTGATYQADNGQD